MATDASSNTVEVSLLERITKIEESLKDLKRAARHELKNRRRRRGVRKDGAEKGAKGETPAQLVAWHNEVRSVWDEMRKQDSKTPYKRAVAEASARRKGGAPVAAAPVKAVKAAAPVAAAAPAKTAAPKKVAKAPKA